jgi:phenylpyruvate tautomerase PptA (4-oxalocrotonate tautomerase family)
MLVNQGKLPLDFPIPYYILNERIASDDKQIRKFRLTTGTTSRQFTPQEQAKDVVGWLDDYWFDWLDKNNSQFKKTNFESLSEKKQHQVRKSKVYYCLLNDEEKEIREGKIRTEGKKEIMKEMRRSQQFIDQLLSVSEIIENSSVAREHLEKGSMSVKALDDARRVAESFEKPIEEIINLSEKVREQQGKKLIAKEVLDITEDILNLPDELVEMVNLEVLPASLAAGLLDKKDALQIVSRAIDLSPERKVTAFNLGIAEEQVLSEKNLDIEDVPKVEEMREEKKKKVPTKISEEERDDLKSKIKSAKSTLENFIDNEFRQQGTKAKFPDDKLVTLAKLCKKIEELIVLSD